MSPTSATATIGPLTAWTVWHPTANRTTAARNRTFGPVARFDPHPAGRPIEHQDGPTIWYGSLLFDTAVSERLNRGADVVDVCPQVRASLVRLRTNVEVFDLTDESTCAAVGADPAVGDTLDADAYRRSQSLARQLVRTSRSSGVRYWSARHRTATGGRHGINLAIWEPGAIGAVVHQHRLVDDALWPHALVALDAADVGVQLVASCGSCS